MVWRSASTFEPTEFSTFYDVTYDDSDCSMGLQSNAIPEFVYFGEMVATKSVKQHSTCLQMCLQNSRCKAVNFFEPLTHKEKGFCELLSESQYDNPRLMRPFKKAIYYEKIRCRTPEDEQEYVLGDETHTTTPTSHSILYYNGPTNTSSPANDTTQGQREDSSITKNREDVEEFTPRPKLFRKSEALSILKKLAAKVHEFNLRFRSR
uniref:Apple domain-containing protein n=1 Tax=Ditylenchus dipsaci TaxID=166011 RepID=A0A915EW88_9BILA